MGGLLIEQSSRGLSGELGTQSKRNVEIFDGSTY